MNGTHMLQNKNDDLDDGFIEEEWQFKRALEAEDEDDDEDTFHVAPRHVSFDDEDADEDAASAGDDSAGCDWDAGTEDEESEDDDEFKGWSEEPADPDED